MIDPKLKRALGQMVVKGVQVVGVAHDGVERGYCSHWVSQVAFEEPIVMASMSPKHDTHPSRSPPASSRSRSWPATTSTSGSTSRIRVVASTTSHRS